MCSVVSLSLSLSLSCFLQLHLGGSERWVWFSVFPSLVSSKTCSRVELALVLSFDLLGKIPVQQEIPVFRVPGQQLLVLIKGSEFPNSYCMVGLSDFQRSGTLAKDPVSRSIHGRVSGSNDR